MKAKTNQRREQLANAHWQQWLDAGYNEQTIEWKNYQQREVFWKEYETLVAEAKASLGDFKISRAAAIHPAVPPLQTQAPASPPVKLSFAGNFSHSVQLPKPLRDNALDGFVKEFANQNAVIFFWGLVAYAIGVAILGGNIGNMSNFIWYALGWGGLAGTRYYLKHDELHSIFELNSQKIIKKGKLGSYTLPNDEVKKLEVIDGNLVLYVQDAYSSAGTFNSAMFIPKDIEHRDDIEQYLEALVKKNNRAVAAAKTKNKAQKHHKRQYKQKIKMQKLSNPHFKHQQQQQKNRRQHHQRMHRRK